MTVPSARARHEVSHDGSRGFASASASFLLAAFALAPPAAAAPSPKPLEAVPFFAGKQVVSLAGAAGEPARLYAVADQSLFVSSDGGAVWTRLDTPPTVQGGHQSIVDAVATHPAQHGLVFAGLATHLARSLDAGESWESLSTGCVRPDLIAFGISEPDRFYVGGPIQHSGCLRLPVTSCGLFRGEGLEPPVCVDGGGTPGLVSSLLVDPADADRVLAGDGGGVYRSEDGGATWSRLTAAFRPRVLRLHPGDHDVVFAGTVEQGLWRSDDFGSTWSRIDEGGFTDDLWDLEVDPVDPTVLHAIVHRGRDVRTSRDGGVSWQGQWTGVPEGFFNDIALHPTDPSVLLMATDDGLYRRELVDDRPCVADERTLCLLDGRVRVQVAWRAYDGSSGLGAAVPETGESGWFWFFDEDNPELVVKVLDGRAVNGELWVFYGSLTSVEMTITANDTLGGEIVSYYNPLNRFASAGDTSAFDFSTPLRAGGAARAASPPWSPPLAWPITASAADSAGETASAACAAPGGLCLHDRFRVTVEWEDFFGNSGAGVPRPLTADAGFFWFFERGNLELVVKVLDAEPVNGHWWVFYGALTNVAYRLRVEDTLTGSERVYDNPLHHFGSRGDTAAFPAGATPAAGAP